MSEGADIVHTMDARVEPQRAFKDKKGNTRQLYKRFRRFFGCFSSQREREHSRSQLPFSREEHGAPDMTCEKSCETNVQGQRDCAHFTKEDFSKASTEPQCRIVELKTEVARIKEKSAVGKAASTHVHDYEDEAQPAVSTNNSDAAAVPLKPRTSEGGTQTPGKLDQTVPRQTLVEVSFPSKSLTSDISTQTEEGTDKAPPSPILAEVILLSNSRASDISTHTENGAGKAPPPRNFAEVSLHPCVEIPVETIRAVGKSPSITFLDDDAIEALPAVLPSKTDDTAAADELPSDETLQDSETVVKTTCNVLRPKENEVSEIRDNEDFRASSALGVTDNNDHLGNIEQLSLQEHERDTSILREPISTPSLSPTSDSSPSELHGPSSISQRFLSFKETEALIEMQSTTGKFSYYILNNGRVIVYPEDDKAKQNQALLKANFMTTTRNEFDVIVKKSSFDGTFCTHRIGAKMLAESQPATVGMYISYDGVLYFISSAHNFVLFTCPTNSQSIDRREILHDGKRARFDVMGTEAPIAPLYYIFSNTTALESRGQKIMHTADIAIGQAPIFTHLITKGIQQFSSSLQEGQDSCRDCSKALEECVARDHRRDPNPCQYKVSRFYDFEVRIYGSQEREGQTVQCVRFHDRKLLDGGGALVRCRPNGKSVVAGRVISFDNRLIFQHPRRDHFDAYNVLLIRPENHLVDPSPGDSGSVWVKDGTNEALAITIGMGRDEDGVWLWAAAPLKPLLEGLCFAFPNHFTDPSKIEPVQLCTGISAGMHGYNNLANQAAAAIPPSGGQITGNDSAYVTNYSQQTE